MKKVILVLALVVSFSGSAWAVDGPSLSYDIGLASGSYSGKSYMELNVGLNYYFLPYLNFRNAVFYRSVTDDDAMYGLDSSLQAGSYVDISDSTRFSYNGGFGYRFASKGKSVPFAVVGGMYRTGGFSLGLRLKQIYRSTHDPEAEDETILSIILAGGGTL